MKNSLCQTCGRSSGTGHKRSHSNIATKRQFRINTQTKRVDGKKIKICTSCLRTQAKQATV